MKIALVNPPYREVMHIVNPAFPLGLGYIKSVCEENGVHCDLFDFSATELTDEELVQKYNLYSYKIIAVSSYSPIFNDIVKFIRQVKNVNNIIVVGGHHVSLVKKKVLEDFEEIDYGLIGFGEYSFLEFVKNFDKLERYKIPGLCYRKGDEYILNSIDYNNFNLDKVPFPDRSDIIYDFNKNNIEDISKGVLSISSSRGCPYKCTYCVNCNNNYWLKRSVENVIEEIEVEYKKNEYNIINFVDCNFMVDIERAYKIIKKILRINSKIAVSFQTRTDQIVDNKEIIEELLSTQRCNIVLGVESNSNIVLKRYKKGTDDKINQAAIDIIKKNGVQPCIYMIMFESLETLEDIRENYNFIKYNNLYSFAMIGNLYQTIIPFYGSDYHTEYERYYTNEVHSQASPIFVDKRVQYLYNSMKIFQNKYQDKITNILIRLDQNLDKNEFKKDRIFLIKSQYLVFEYFLIMCEKFKFCYYESFKESKLCKVIDSKLEEYLNLVDRLEKYNNEKIDVY